MQSYNILNILNIYCLNIAFFIICLDLIIVTSNYCVLHYIGSRRQERAATVPGLKLSEHDARQALHLHDAHATR